jgi:riboflavin synthase
MFTGIIEDIGKVVKLEMEDQNLHLFIQSKIVKEAYIDQSIAHNGVCLTVVKILDDFYQVTAVKETLDKTNLGELTIGDSINLERCMVPNQRLDGHFVQGHVDTTLVCKNIEEEGGSWRYFFEIPLEYKNLIVPKGSISLNGTSLTVILDDHSANDFSIAIIPYTYEHTIFKFMKIGDKVNVEFDIFGKYVARYFQTLNS